MKDETTMSAAFAKVGVDRNEQRLYADMARFINNGGTVARIHALADIAAERMPGGDHVQDVRKDQNRSVPARRPEASGADHVRGVPRGDHPGFVRPARAPSAVDIAAARRVRKKEASSVFNRMIGGQLRLGLSCRTDFINFTRRCDIGSHMGRRFITEINWINDTTPLEKCATEKQVLEILNSGPTATRFLEQGHA